MRVTLVTNSIPPYRESLYECLNARVSGGLRVVTTLRDTLAPRRYEVVSCRLCTAIPRWRHHPLGYRDRARTPIPLLLARDIGECDVIVVHGLGLSTMAAALHARRLGIPMVVWATLSLDTELGRGWITTTARRRLIQHAAAVIVNGASGRRYVDDLVAGGREVPIIAVPYTIETAPFLSIPIERTADQRHRLLTIGQLIPRKGLLEFADTVAAWLDSHPARVITWTIVGEGVLRNTLEHRRPHSRLLIDVRAGVKYDQLQSVYAEHGVFVFPTLADEWGVVVNEAMASGLPVLGSVRAQAVQELVVDGETGVTFDPLGSNDQKTAAFERLLERSDLDAMGRKARSVAMRVTAADAAARIVELLETVA